MKYKFYTAGSDEYGYGVIIQLSEYDGKLMGFLKRNENYGFEKTFGSIVGKHFNASKQDAKSMYYYQTNHRIHTSIEVSRLIERIKNFIEGTQPETPQKNTRKEVGDMNLEEFHNFVMKFNFFISQDDHSHENDQNRFIGLPPMKPTFYFHFENKTIEGDSVSSVIVDAWNYLQSVPKSERKNVLKKIYFFENLIAYIIYLKKDADGVFAKNPELLKEIVDSKMKAIDSFYRKNKQTIEDYYGYFPHDFERDYKDLQEALKNCSHPQHARVVQFGINFMKSLKVQTKLPTKKEDNLSPAPVANKKQILESSLKTLERTLRKEPNNQVILSAKKTLEREIKRLNA